MRYIFFLVFSLNVVTCLGQSELLKKEIDLTVDNDAFYIINEEDRYYSSGIFATYRQGLDSSNQFSSNLSRLIGSRLVSVGFHFTHLMFTPQNIKYSEVQQLDRPYAGALAIGSSISLFTRRNWFFQSQLDLGLLGPGTKTGEIQVWWHDKWNMKEPRGWQYQVNNTPYINLLLEWNKGIKIDQWLDFVYEGKLEAGTIFTRTSHGGVLRIGSLQGLGQSGYRNGMIGSVRNSERQKPVEWYIFWGIMPEYVFYNTTIEGNFIGKQSPYTETASSWVLRRKTGFNIHWKKFDFGLHFYFNTPETKKASEHRYIRIRLTQRF